MDTVIPNQKRHPLQDHSNDMDPLNASKPANAQQPDVYPSDAKMADLKSADRLLHILKRLHTATAQALADELCLSVPAVRRHLQNLQEQQLLSLQIEKPGGRGRPQHVYRLTDAGEAAAFPRHYELLCQEIFQHISSLFGRGAVMQLMDARRADLYQRFAPSCQAAHSVDDKARALAKQLESYGYAAQVESFGGQWYLTEYNCPAPAIARNFPELCQSELELYAELLGCELVRETRIVCGAAHCRYRLQEASQ